ncbi:hypothetical protein ACHQM5_020241 [Ranunculus cassubicifolius]
MAINVCSTANWQLKPYYSSLQNPTSNFPAKNTIRATHFSTTRKSLTIANCSEKDQIKDEEVEDLGVKAALSMLKFYKREISPLMPNSCRYVPTCSEYSMIAYKRYGVAKGTILTAWRLCRCNPLGGSGFDPPRWFDEGNTPEQ